MPLLFIIQTAHTIKKNPAAHLLTERKSNLLCLPWLNSPLMDYIKLPFSLSKKLSRFTVWVGLPFLQTQCNLQYAARGPLCHADLQLPCVSSDRAKPLQQTLHTCSCHNVTLLKATCMAHGSRKQGNKRKLVTYFIPREMGRYLNPINVNVPMKD